MYDSTEVEITSLILETERVGGWEAEEAARGLLEEGIRDFKQAREKTRFS